MIISVFESFSSVNPLKHIIKAVAALAVSEFVQFNIPHLHRCLYNENKLSYYVEKMLKTNFMVCFFSNILRKKPNLLMLVSSC